MPFELEGRPQSLLTVGNPKTAKGEKLGWLTAILHLSPHKGSGVANVCAHASPGCIAACLNTAGRGGMGLDEDGLNVIQAARIRRTRWFTNHKDEFMADLVAEIEKHLQTAARHGLKPCVRLNGTSDLPWENIKIGNGSLDATIPEFFPDVQFYDYTKFPVRLRKRALERNNYDLSFSLAENNDDKAKEALAAGVNIVAVFAVKKGRPLPDTYWEHKVIDGDEHDLRFLDPKGVVVGLRAKGRGINDESGFVRHA